MIVDRALVAIITGEAVEVISAARGGQARVGRADVLVIAVHDRGTDAQAVEAGVSRGARVGVITSKAVGGVNTHAVRPAGVIRARIPVVTVLVDTWTARALEARITQGAQIAVRAWRARCGQVRAALIGQAKILCAGISVVALQGSDSDADSVGARVIDRAVAAIGAGRLVGSELAAHLRVTHIGRAGVPIVTGDLIQARLAATGLAKIPDAAHAAIITGEVVGLIHAAAQGIT